LSNFTATNAAPLWFTNAIDALYARIDERIGRIDERIGRIEIGVVRAANATAISSDHFVIAPDFFNSPFPMTVNALNTITADSCDAVIAALNIPHQAAVGAPVPVNTKRNFLLSYLGLRHRL